VVEWAAWCNNHSSQTEAAANCLKMCAKYVTLSIPFPEVILTMRCCEASVMQINRNRIGHDYRLSSARCDACLHLHLYLELVEASTKRATASAF
jgi:hypothetical protein